MPPFVVGVVEVISDVSVEMSVSREVGLFGSSEGIQAIDGWKTKDDAGVATVRVINNPPLVLALAYHLPTRFWHSSLGSPSENGGRKQGAPNCVEANTW